MATKIFATGTTGYIGGDFLFLLLQTHPDWAPSITCLVRNEERGKSLKNAYPEVQLVYSALDDAAILEDEAEKADVVLHFASSDHVGAAESIAKGLKKRAESGKGAHWIHTSGTDILLLQDGENQEAIKTFDDWGSIGECTSRPDLSPHRLIDKIILSTSSPTICTAIVCPSLIYGRGRGPGNQRSVQAYELCRLILERGKGFTIGNGEDYMWFHIHIYDLSRLYLCLLEATVSNDDSKATWGDQGYYLGIKDDGDHRWNDLARAITKEACKQGVLRDVAMEVLDSKDHGMVYQAMGPAVWNVKSRAEAIRAGKVLGWQARERGLLLEVGAIVEGEVRRMGRG